MSRSGCPVCGAPHVACGATGRAPTPVDFEIQEVAMSGELKKYEVTDERGHKGVFKLTAEHAKRLNAKPLDTKAAAPANKSRTAQNKKA